MKRYILLLLSFAALLFFITAAGAAGINSPQSIPWGQSKAEGIKAFGLDPLLYKDKSALTVPGLRMLGNKKALLVYFYGKNGLGAVGLSAIREINPGLTDAAAQAFANELSATLDKDFGKRAFSNKPFMKGITVSAWSDGKGFYYLVYLDKTKEVGGVHFRLMREADFKQQFKK